MILVMLKLNLIILTFFRCDRKNGKAGGGSCIFVHKSIDAEHIQDFLAPDSVGVSVWIQNHVTKYFCIYRSQNLDFAERSELLQSIKSIKWNPTEEVQIYGDFNLPSVNWEQSIVNCPINTVNTFYTTQQDFFICII